MNLLHWTLKSKCGINSSIYLRIPFNLNDVNSIESLVLSARVDDGFVAWLNGGLVQEFKAPDPIEWDSQATATNTDSTALKMIQYSLDDHMDKLKNGQNLLAIQALNKGKIGSDFLFSCQLGGLEVTVIFQGKFPKKRERSSTELKLNKFIF